MENKYQDRIFIGKWIKLANGSLSFKFKKDESAFQELVAKLKVNQCVDVFVDFSDDLGRLSQIAKLKSGIREIARETGETFITIEHVIKKEAGLYDEISQEYKSFGNCSIQQLSDAIQVLLEKAEFTGTKIPR